MSDRVFYFTTVFERAHLPEGVSTIFLPAPSVALLHNKLISVEIGSDWRDRLEHLGKSDHHQAILTGRDLEDFSGDETALTITFEPINQKAHQSSAMENIGKWIRQAIFFAWRLELASSGYMFFNMLSDSDGQVWSTGARFPEYVSFDNDGLTAESIRNIKDFYLIIHDELLKYNSAHGIDSEEGGEPPPGLQIRNRLTKALRWFDSGLSARGFDVGFVCFSVALEALITNENQGPATPHFMKRVAWLANEAEVPVTKKELEDIYNLRSRLIHGDMAVGYHATALDLFKKVYSLLGGIIKYLIADSARLSVFSSNTTPDQALTDIKKFFRTADTV